MNILLVANWESGVGYAWWLMENFWVTIARHYESRNQRCILIYPRITEIPRAIAESSIEVVEMDFGDASAEARARLGRLIREKEIGSVYLTDRPYVSGAYLFLRRAGVRKIFLHDHTPGERTVPSMPKRLIKSALMRMPGITASHYIGVTPYVRRRLIEVARVPASRCSFASNGIVPRPRHEETRQRYRALLGADPDTTVVVSTGRAHRYKGIDFIIRAAAQLLDSDKDRRFLFVHCGDGPHLEEFRSLVHQLGLEAAFLFLGKRSDVPDLLQGCDMAIHASQGEVGYSLSILEYMSAGLVAFVPDRESVCQCVTDGRDGIIYKHDDVGDLVARIEDIGREPEKAARIAANAARTVRTDYTLENTNTQLIDVLEEHDFA